MSPDDSLKNVRKCYDVLSKPKPGYRWAEVG
jgi:hypothetical protein